MRNVKIADTSREAHQRVHGNMLRDHYDRILKTLQLLGTANYESIAIQGRFTDRNQVSRRLKEMVELGMVERTDIKSATTSGRNAYNYIVAGENKSVPQMVDDIVRQCTTPKNKPTNPLFGF